jgi:hypothetical protein
MTVLAHYNYDGVNDHDVRITGGTIAPNIESALNHITIRHNLHYKKWKSIKVFDKTSGEVFINHKLETVDRTPVNSRPPLSPAPLVVPSPTAANPPIKMATEDKPRIVLAPPTVLKTRDFFKVTQA